MKAFGGRPRSPPREGGPENNQPTNTWGLRRSVSPGLDNFQYQDNTEVHGATSDIQWQGINPEIQQSLSKNVGAIEGENIGVSIPIFMEKSKVNSSADQMVRLDNRWAKLTEAK